LKADFYARMEAARLMLWKACWKVDRGEDFQLESSLAKYLAVDVARHVTGLGGGPVRRRLRDI